MNQLQHLGSSETTRAACSQKKMKAKTLKCKTHFQDWLAGLIDGDGCFLVSKKGYTSCEITVGEDEKDVLYRVKQKLGGSVNLRTGVRAYRWRLHNRKGMLNLVSLVENRLRLSIRQKQLENVKNAPSLSTKEDIILSGPNINKDGRMMQKVHLKVTANKSERFVESNDTGYSHSITKKAVSGSLKSISNNYWLAGFFDAEGYLNVNRANLQCTITLTQKEADILYTIQKEMGGAVHYDKSWQGYIYSASSKLDLEKWFSYFSTYALKCSKKVILLKRFKRIILFKSKRYHWKTSPLLYQQRFRRLLDRGCGISDPYPPPCVMHHGMMQEIHSLAYFR